MSTILLAIYIALICVRPMDWWQPILGWQVVNATAIITLLVTFPRIMDELPILWQQVPVLRVAAALLVGVSLSWVYPLWLTGIFTAFQDFGKIVILYTLIILLARSHRLNR
jgi:hypothetical protein